MKAVVILPAAAKALRKHRTKAERMLDKIEKYAADPSSHSHNVKMLKGSRARRLRIGDFRIVFEETATEIIVSRIGPRGSIYE